MNPSVILVEDKADIRDTFSATFKALDINMELIPLGSVEEFQETFLKLNETGEYHMVKVLIFDLALNGSEDGGKKYKISQEIELNFHENRVPIFIHSAYIEYYNEFEQFGTVFKVVKGQDTIPQICEKIKLLSESGFLDLFSVHGGIEKRLMAELHTAFTKQFKGEEIVEIIKSIQLTDEGGGIARVKDVFERIAVRSLYQNIMDVKMAAEQQSIEVSVNAVEHYYRRTNTVKFWTGDIFEEKEGGVKVFIITPRCNISNKNYQSILICSIIPIGEQEKAAFKNIKKGNLRKGLTDDVTLSLIGERKRFLTKTPQFEGGFVDFVTHKTIDEDEFHAKYNYHVSVIDDLTNDVIRKFSSYMLRGGVSVTEEAEALYYIQSNYGLEE